MDAHVAFATAWMARSERVIVDVVYVMGDGVGESLAYLLGGG
jgi:hypothetical protein